MAKLKTPGFFEDWIDGCGLFSAPLDSLTSCHDPRFPRAFYQRCVIVFAKLNIVRFGPIQRSRALNTALSKLALWTEGFADGELDRALGESPQLKNAILELLSSLAVSLIKGLFIPIALISKLTECSSILNVSLDEVFPR